MTDLTAPQEPIDVSRLIYWLGQVREGVIRSQAARLDAAVSELQRRQSD